MRREILRMVILLKIKKKFPIKYVRKRFFYKLSAILKKEEVIMNTFLYVLYYKLYTHKKVVAVPELNCIPITNQIRRWAFSFSQNYLNISIFFFFIICHPSP